MHQSLRHRRTKTESDVRSAAVGFERNRKLRCIPHRTANEQRTPGSWCPVAQETLRRVSSCTSFPVIRGSSVCWKVLWDSDGCAGAQVARGSQVEPPARKSGHRSLRKLYCNVLHSAGIRSWPVPPEGTAVRSKFPQDGLIFLFARELRCPIEPRGRDLGTAYFRNQPPRCYLRPGRRKDVRSIRTRNARYGNVALKADRLLVPEPGVVRAHWFKTAHAARSPAFPALHC